MKNIAIDSLYCLVLTLKQISFRDTKRSAHSCVADTGPNGIETSPFSLVSLAYQGHLRSQGISSYGVLIMAHRQRQISALDLVQAAVNTNLLPTEFLENSKYLKAVENGF